MKVVFSIDFSASNGHLHGTDYENPYIRVMKLIQPIAEHFDDDGNILAYRFGCYKTKNIGVCPLSETQKESFKGFNELIEEYKQAAETVEQSGPTTFAGTI